MYAKRNAICVLNDLCQVETKQKPRVNNGQACVAGVEPALAVVVVHELQAVFLWFAQGFDVQ